MPPLERLRPGGGQIDVLRQLAVVLGVDPAELNALLASEASAIRYQDNLEPATAKRVDQLALAGLLVQQNPVHLVRAAWLEAGPASIDEVPVDPANPGSRGADWVARIKPAVWAALTPLWEGSEAPEQRSVEARLRAPFVYLAREVPLELGEAVEAAIKDRPELAGLSVHREYRREYPQGEVAKLLLGRADVDERGISGLESLYNQILTGVDGFRKVTVSALGRPIMQEREELVPPVHGKNVELTIDVVLQGYAEEALLKAITDNDADWGLAVVVEPNSGEVLAMADAASATHDVPPMNRGLSIAYEPGSIIKPLVVAGALEAGLTQPHEGFYCGGRVKVGRRTLSCIKEHGPETVADAVRDSCNMVMIRLAERMRQERLERNFRALGLLSRTGLGLQGQEAIGGIFENSEDGRWSIQKVATVSYGKGIQCTAVGLARAYCALLNGGTLPRLHLVRRIREQDGAVVVEQPVEPGPRLFGAPTTQRVREMLRAVVAHEEGTGQLAASELYDMGGKTGTSIAYDADDQRVVSFVGFAPYEKPRLLVLVSVAEPRAGMRWGSTTCGPAAREIIEKGLQYLGVPPKPPAPKEQPE
ncbi:MAG: penicillin-binding protein 2 [Armatimonadetes bacterium]|nr:penicillin-binding protein 2 [Armatimonadota bacterium]